MSKIEYNVFEGYQCKGLPVVVISGGRVAFKDGDMRAKAGDGKYIERPAFSPVHVANSTWKTANRPKGVKRLAVTP